MLSSLEMTPATKGFCPSQVEHLTPTRPPVSPPTSTHHPRRFHRTGEKEATNKEIKQKRFNLAERAACMRALPFPANENFYSNNINDHKMNTKHAAMSTIIIIMTILVNIKKQLYHHHHYYYHYHYFHNSSNSKNSNNNNANINNNKNQTIITPPPPTTPINKVE